MTINNLGRVIFLQPTLMRAMFGLALSIWACTLAASGLECQQGTATYDNYDAWREAGATWDIKDNHIIHSPPWEEIKYKSAPDTCTAVDRSNFGYPYCVGHMTGTPGTNGKFHLYRGCDDWQYDGFRRELVHIARVRERRMVEETRSTNECSILRGNPYLSLLCYFKTDFPRRGRSIHLPCGFVYDTWMRGITSHTPRRPYLSCFSGYPFGRNSSYEIYPPPCARGVDLDEGSTGVSASSRSALKVFLIATTAVLACYPSVWY